MEVDSAYREVVTGPGRYDDRIKRWLVAEIDLIDPHEMLFRKPFWNKNRLPPGGVEVFKLLAIILAKHRLGKQ